MTLLAPLVYFDGVEVIPADEAADIQRVLLAMQTLLERSRAQSGHFRGDVHVKAHGCALGEFHVLRNLPPELSQGVFACERTFPAVVRFTNSASQPQSDLLPDGRGVAMKLFDVDGERLSQDQAQDRTQDFLMVNHPVFVARNVKDFLRLEQLRITAQDHPVAAAVEGLTAGHWNPLRWHWREALAVAEVATHPPAHPAGMTYYSMAPIRFGQYVVKYRVQPRWGLSGSSKDLVARLATQSDALRLILEETLRSQDVLLDFQVQLRTSADTMPVEDAMIEWPQDESPFRTVAELRLPQQEIGTSEQKARCLQLSFNVWNALADHRPLGGINRLRRAAYPFSAAWRLREQAGMPL